MSATGMSGMRGRDSALWNAFADISTACKSNRSAAPLPLDPASSNCRVNDPAYNATIDSATKTPTDESGYARSWIPASAGTTASESSHQRKESAALRSVRTSHYPTPTLPRTRGREQSGIPLPLKIRDVLDLMTPLPSIERTHSMPMPFPTLTHPPSLPINRILRPIQRKAFQREDRAIPLFGTGLRVGSDRQQHVLQAIGAHALR